MKALKAFIFVYFWASIGFTVVLAGTQHSMMWLYIAIFEAFVMCMWMFPIFKYKVEKDDETNTDIEDE
ncbi:MAG TPA: hypothetical protein VJ954_03050 [Ignavibacteriaceae bacterium]|nr:hypothetical protein [Ignavibacteriaceae bacterium]